MITVRLAQQLARKVKRAKLETVPLDDDPLRDWSMQMFIFDRKQHVLMCNTRTLYSAVFLARGITSALALLRAGLAAIEQQLEFDLLVDAYHNRCPKGPLTVQYAKSLNRSVVGSLNEQIIAASYPLADGENLVVAGAECNRNLLSALGDSASPDFGRPYEVMKRLLEGSSGH